MSHRPAPPVWAPAPALIVLALGACRGSRDDPPRDVSALPLGRVEDAVPGRPFAIDLPAGLVREATGAAVTWRWPAGAGAAPSITVTRVDVPATLDAAVAAARLTSDPALVIATQQQVHDGYLISVYRPDDRYLATESTRTFGGTALRCSVVERTSASQGPIPARAQTIALAETICVSLAPR